MFNVDQDKHHVLTMWCRVLILLVVCVTMTGSYRIEQVSVYTSNNSTTITWSVETLTEPINRWHSTQVTVGWLARNTHVRYPVADRQSRLVIHHLEKGLSYQVTIVLVDHRFINISQKYVTNFTLEPAPVLNFSASLDYHNLSNDNYPKFISFEYDIQRRSDYSGHRIQCGKQLDNGSLDYTFDMIYESRYSSWDENIAYGKNTTQSSVFTLDQFLHNSRFAVDRKIGLHSTPAKTLFAVHAWWKVDLGKISVIEMLILYNVQTLCSYHYCRDLSRQVKYFSNVHVHGREVCKNTTTNILRRYKELGFDVREVDVFNPVFNARTLAICSENSFTRPLTLVEVEIFGSRKLIHKKRTVQIEERHFTAGIPIVCQIISVANNGLSLPVKLSDPLITAPVPLKKIFTNFTSTELRIYFELQFTKFELYRNLSIHFLFDGIQYTLDSTIDEFTYDVKLLVPGKPYLIESWTSARLSVGKVNSNRNLTTTILYLPVFPTSPAIFGIKHFDSCSETWLNYPSISVDGIHPYVVEILKQEKPNINNSLHFSSIVLLGGAILIQVVAMTWLLSQRYKSYWLKAQQNIIRATMESRKMLCSKERPVPCAQSLTDYVQELDRKIYHASIRN